ncbi:hypothetical protein RND71_031849 [Anisodus tanguticus]|uniref:Uncharacterized protein n=1 Tax=Anisodus tanguticus TaxID=243964 RepID=A0AAE1RBG3_9SOLA|nr:hypothetical protein RND71_031849 [Anisodus tanguticus]
MSTERANRHQRRPSQSFNFVLPENISLADPLADSDSGGREQNKVVLPPPSSKSGLGRTASGVSLPPFPVVESSEKEGTTHAGRRQG